MKQVTAILLGAGQRGAEAYASYALDYPNELKFVAVAEPRADRREEFAKLHDIAPQNAVESDMELLNRPKMADCVLICTQDQMHYEALKLAVEKGYHILCEKPISPVKSELIEIGEIAKNYDKVISICPVSYTHLDVYKRQECGTIGGKRCFTRSRTETGKRSYQGGSKRRKWEAVDSDQR